MSRIRLFSQLRSGSKITARALSLRRIVVVKYVISKHETHVGIFSYNSADYPVRPLWD
jgi:hypothetical protein